jgi:hypothetical protein
MRTPQPPLLKNTFQAISKRRLRNLSSVLLALNHNSIYSRHETFAPDSSDMDVESQPSLRDQLFESTICVLDVISKAEYHERADFGALEEHLESLQDTLLGSSHICNPQLDPFYALCLQLCDSIRNQSSPGGNTSHLPNVSVVGYTSCQLRDVLSALFHALSTYLNIIRWYVIRIHYNLYAMLRYRLVTVEHSMTTASSGVWPAYLVPSVALRDTEYISIASTNLCLV